MLVTKTENREETERQYINLIKMSENELKNGTELLLSLALSLDLLEQYKASKKNKQNKTRTKCKTSSSHDFK